MLNLIISSYNRIIGSRSHIIISLITIITLIYWSRYLHRSFSILCLIISGVIQTLIGSKRHSWAEHLGFCEGNKKKLLFLLCDPHLLLCPECFLWRSFFLPQCFLWEWLSFLDVFFLCDFLLKGDGVVGGLSHSS